MFVTQTVLYILLRESAAKCLHRHRLLCWPVRGRFATMPASRRTPSDRGTSEGSTVMLTAWGAAGIAGPLVFAR
jgi:hypothetical protein